ncbi:MAG: hypothetical protein IJZ56_03455 [Oscillospiraceae bacterium]|nr:hypothetical protein [Oscillospiraceae bacterium]
MSSVVNVGRQVGSFRSAPQFDGYTKVIIIVSDDVEYSAGTDTGRTLTVTNPWGTQAMADNLLSKIKGFQYQPYTAKNAILDPAAELGDGINANFVYGGIYSMETKFGRTLRATVSAPSDEEIDHEYPYVSKQERKVTRRLYQLSSELRVQAGLISAEVSERKTETEQLFAQLSLQSNQIAAKVSKSGGDSSSFGWVLDDSSWTIKANSTDILKATKNGLEIYGKITATSGKIGGFDIASNSLTYNNQTWGGTNTTGIYIGPSGIQLGKNFKVDASGNLTAASGTFTGNVRAGSIQYGGDNGTLHASALTGHSITGSQIGYNTISTAYTSGGINTSLGYADFANGVFNGWNQASQMTCSVLNVTSKDFKFAGRTCYLGSKHVMTSTGSVETIQYIGWS